MSKISTLIPKDQTKQKDQMADALSVLSHIRAYVIAIEATSLQNILDPAPSWFKTLSTNLAAAQKHSEPWQKTLEPGITSTIPQAIINMGSRFGTATDAILDILNSTDVPTAAQIKNITQALDWITEHISTQQGDIKKLQDAFSTFSSDAHTDYTTLTSGVDSIQTAILDDQDLISTLQGDIAVDEANIAKDKAAITAAGIAAGVGLFAGVSIIGLGAAATGPAAPIAILIGAFILVGSVAELAAVLAVYIPKLEKAQSKLRKDTAKLNYEQQQVASLTVMKNSITNLTSLNQKMAQSLQDITDWFADLSKQVSTVSTDIKDSQGDLTKADWFSLKLDIQQAQKDWKQLADYATQWQKTATTIQNKLVNVAKKATSNAA